MYKSFLIFLFLIICVPTLGQNLTKPEVDRLVKLYTEQEKYDSTSLMLVSFANQEHQKGNLDTALEYQIMNCRLVEQYINFFVDHGFTLQDMYNNYGMIMVLQRDLNQTTDAINTYLELSKTIKQYTPEDLPFYTNLIASTIGKCTTMPLADSIYCIQDALNIIKQQRVTEDNIKKYLWLCRCFNMNRMYNSFNNKALVYNRIEEIESWYERNYSYIHELDTTLFKKDILEYDLEYADLLYLFAGAIGAQKQDLIEAIELYHKEISLLSSIEIVDTRINLKIASCYARIANNYYQLGNLPLCKQYCDKAYPYMFNQVDELEYCDVLSALANIYYNTDQAKIAAKLKLNEIRIRERVEGNVSLTDWSQYFLYIVDTNPEEVILQENNLGNVRQSEGGDAGYYIILGKAYSALINVHENYTAIAEMNFNKADSILSANHYYEKYGIKNLIQGNLYEAWANHYSTLGQRRKSYEYSIKASELFPEEINNYYNVALKSCLLHDSVGIRTYLPKFYHRKEMELYNMIPILGSVESDTYLGNGESSIYHIPEWASWNPTDSICIGIAYDAALLMKGLTLRYNVLSPYYESHPEIVSSKIELDKMRDSIYTISNDDARLLALYQYELKEREILKEVNRELTIVHWKDVLHCLKKDEACVEFVKYTANAYSWNDGTPQNHYAALVLLGSGENPIFVDLFDEQDIYETYHLQPKSYETKAGAELYDKIWGKLSNYIANKSQVFFSPMGMLNLINIESLVNKYGHTALETYNLKRVSSTRQLIAPAKENQIHSVISYGGIDYAEMSSEIIDSLNTRGNWNYLKNTLTEVRNIQETLQKRNTSVTTIIGSNATETSFKKLNGTTASIIHIASHGFYIPLQRRETIPFYGKSNYTQKIKDELFYSGLIMSGGQMAWTNSTFEIEKDDGILTSYEISKIDLHNVDLVVLSACETGLGDNLFDGIFGLQRAFKKTGVKSILMSLWKIDDKTTSEYMSLFYNNLTSGLSKYESYNRTVADMKKKYEDPYYWASFILLD